MTRSLIFSAPMVSTGYGIAGAYFYKNLIQQEIDVSCFPIQIDNTFFTNEEIDKLYNESTKKWKCELTINILLPLLSLWPYPKAPNCHPLLLS